MPVEIDAGDVSSIGFHVDGAVLDNVTCADVPSPTKATGCDTVASMAGGTLVVTLNLFSNSGGTSQARTNFQVRAFSGPATYIVDGTKDAGTFEYYSGETDMYGPLAYTIQQGDIASCTFDIQSAGVVDGTFHCENLRAYRWDGTTLITQRATITNGTLHLVL